MTTYANKAKLLTQAAIEPAKPPQRISRPTFDSILADNDPHEFAILLAGGACYSRKTIRLQKNGKYAITNHIDNSTQRLTQKQLEDSNITHIGEALKKNALMYFPAEDIEYDTD